MGSFHYGRLPYKIQIDDRPLAHLKVALLSLVRAGRSVAFTFEHPRDTGSGRDTLWVTPTTELRFLFRTAPAPAVSEHWVRAIIASAGTPAGMRLVPEPTPAAVESS